MKLVLKFLTYLSDGTICPSIEVQFQLCCNTPNSWQLCCIYPIKLPCSNLTSCMLFYIWTVVLLAKLVVGYPTKFPSTFPVFYSKHWNRVHVRIRVWVLWLCLSFQYGWLLPAWGWSCLISSNEYLAGFQGTSSPFPSSLTLLVANAIFYMSFY